MMHSGWKTLIVPPDAKPCSVVRVEVDGQQNKVRVRQVQVLVPPPKPLDSTYPATVAQQKACEAEALRVFRSLTSQVCVKTLKSVFTLLMLALTCCCLYTGVWRTAEC